MNEKPVILAHFALDGSGRPRSTQANDRRHYSITLRVDGTPSDTYAVTYQLHDSYYNPSRESRLRTNGFSEEITSYGNYTVQAKVRSATHVSTTASSLYHALQRGHGPSPSQSVAEAMEYIRRH